MEVEIYLLFPAFLLPRAPPRSREERTLAFGLLSHIEFLSRRDAERTGNIKVGFSWTDGKIDKAVIASPLGSLVSR